jgi:cytidylate kinase
MENLLLKYMEESFQKTDANPTGRCNPIVTLSREYGCPSKLIGLMLVEALNRRRGNASARKWRLINKEILEESARELSVPENQIKSMLDADKKGVVMDILTFSTTYGGSERIRRTVQKVIRSFASSGYAVIIGRGGVAVTRDHPNALHVRLTAPIEWRAGEISARYGIPLLQARETAEEVDLKRHKLIENLLGRKPDPYLFDLAFNCMYLGKEEIVQSTVSLMEIKKMI